MVVHIVVLLERNEAAYVNLVFCGASCEVLMVADQFDDLVLVERSEVVDDALLLDI